VLSSLGMREGEEGVADVEGTVEVAVAKEDDVVKVVVAEEDDVVEVAIAEEEDDDGPVEIITVPDSPPTRSAYKQTARIWISP
jgi:hypothetical protein